MKTSRNLLLYLLCLISLILASSSLVLAQTPKPKILKPCNQCHAPDEKILRGTLGGISQKAETFSVNAGIIWTVKFDDKTKLTGWPPPVGKIPKDKEIAVKFIERDGEVYAESISVKQPAKLPEDKVVSTEFVAEAVERGDALIIDSRPAVRYYEGAIPTAINIYDAEFDKHIDKLPKDKNKLIIFYCAGPT
ncbi:MAG: rhodanese-like domain-containing protein [Thermodesulfovibrionales bacterium]|nr:rhodanese-like domain-containing protein [Thermodesulfovibrionales bacterium]